MNVSVAELTMSIYAKPPCNITFIVDEAVHLKTPQLATGSLLRVEHLTLYRRLSQKREVSGLLCVGSLSRNYVEVNSSMVPVASMVNE